MRHDPVTAAAAAAPIIVTSLSALADEGGAFRLPVTFEDARAIPIPQHGATATTGETPGVVAVFDGTAQPFRSGMFESQSSVMTRRSADGTVVEGYGIRRDAIGLCTGCERTACLVARHVPPLDTPERFDDEEI